MAARRADFSEAGRSRARREKQRSFFDGSEAARRPAHDAPAGAKAYTPAPGTPTAGHEQKPAPRWWRVPTWESVADGRDPIGKAWLEFHEANPLVAETFLGEAAIRYREAARVGVKEEEIRLSAKDLGEQVRRKLRPLLRPDGSGYRVNNNYWPLYARWAMDRREIFGGCFELRRRVGEK